MTQMYNYNRSAEELFNDVVDEVIYFAAAQLEGKKVENSEERIKNLNYNMVKYAVTDTKAEKIFEADGLDAMRNPKVYKNDDVLNNYNAIMTEIINPLLPMVASKDFARYFAEVRQIGWGDTARFIVKSNELYKVNEIAEGVNRGVLQPIFNNEFTVNTKKTEVAASVDWYQVAAGVMDWGDFGLRYAKSFEAYIFLEILAALTSATNSLGGAYQVSGFSQNNWSNMVQRVSAANGGAPVYALGTLNALNQVYPTSVGLQYGLGEEIAKKGFLDRYMGATLVPINQIFQPLGAVNTTGAFGIPDDVIYFIAADQNAPVKIVYEGDSSVVERDPDYTPDRTYRIRIQIRVGVAAVVGSKFGTMTL